MFGRGTPTQPARTAEPAAPPSLTVGIGRVATALMSAIAVQRATRATAETERAALLQQINAFEQTLAVRPAAGTEEGLMAAHAVDVLRVRLEGVEQRIRDCTAALWHSEAALEVLHSSDGDLDVDVGLASWRNSRQLFQTVEEERMRIARDVHDGPAQVLANLVLKAEIVERLYDRDPTTAARELAEFKATARTALEDTRRLIFDLRPMTLDDLGLVPTLRKFLADFEQRSGIRTRFSMLGAERRLPRDLEAAFFRIIQEAMTNARKHAHASVIDVSLNLGANRAVASVKDDGTGFDVAEAERRATRTSHLGLVSMRERAGLENGALDIISEPGRGTLIRVSADY